MSISIVISTWKRPVQLKLILTELNLQAKENNLKLEVIIADSHSGKETDEVILNAISVFKNINIVHGHTKNILASKRNFGAALATEKYIVFLDDDCVPAERFITVVLTNIKQYDEKTVLCGEIRFEPQLVKKSNYYRYRDSLHPKYSESGAQNLSAWHFVAMNNTIVKSAFSSGLVSYNESFTGYGCEDHEFGWQLKKNNFNIIFFSGKIIHHEYGGDIESYARKIYVTARDGMNVLRKVCPEMFVGNKKLELIEWFFKYRMPGAIVRNLFFNKFFLKNIVLFLKKTDENKKFYIPILYRYVLITSYIQGMKARGKVNINELIKNWYI